MFKTFGYGSLLPGKVLIKTNGSALSSDAFKELAVSAWQAHVVTCFEVS